jgi:hypothetical protein
MSMWFATMPVLPAAVASTTSHSIIGDGWEAQRMFLPAYCGFEREHFGNIASLGRYCANRQSVGATPCFGDNKGSALTRNTF